jgi:uncharacterized membrane protein YeiB
MLYGLLGFALRPFRRWWRRAVIAGVVAVVVVPAVRQMLDDAVTQPRDTISVPPPTP